jgi:hypothetical protein
MTHFLKLAESLPVAPVLAEIEAHPELWDAYRERKDAFRSPHAQMSDIWVRYNSRDRLGPNFNDEHVPVNYPAWDALPTVRAISFAIMAAEQGQMLGGILITRIPPGGRIAPHVDSGWHVNYFSKFYVALKSPIGSSFSTETPSGIETITPAVGDLHRFDNRNLHWVENNSSEDKMTLIVCVRTDKYR